MIRRPPRSTRTDTLFPYTTLFRSYTDAKCTETTAACTDGDQLPSVPKIAAAMPADYSFAVGGSAEARIGGAVRIVGDRISAVASSPLAISVEGYAVLDLNASVTFDEKDRKSTRLNSSQ